MHMSSNLILKKSLTKPTESDGKIVNCFQKIASLRDFLQIADKEYLYFQIFTQFNFAESSLSCL